MDNGKIYQNELIRINSSRGNNENINMLLGLYRNLDDKERSYYNNSFKYVVYTSILFLLNNAEKTNDKWDINAVKTRVNNILNAEPDFDFSVLKKEKLDELVLGVKITRT